MNAAHLRKLTNDFDAVRLISLHALKLAAESNSTDHGGPYVVMQEGYDPADPAMVPGEFLLGKSGTWLAVPWFVRMPGEQRRKEFIYTSAAEVIELLENLTGHAVVRGPDAGSIGESTPVDEEWSSVLKASEP